MKKTSLEIAKPHIINYLVNRNQKYYKRKELYEIFATMREKWSLALSTTTTKFIKYLLKEKLLTELTLDFPNRKETRFIKGKIDIFKVLLAVNPNGYYSHITALYLNKLLSEKSNHIFWNVEQLKKKIYSNTLDQEGIDKSFNNKSRITNNICAYDGYVIYGINGMYTGNLGVIEKNGIRYTNLERTLLDIIVRPQYAGGIETVLNVFKKSKGKVRTDKLLEYYNNIKYIYPYHQSIGFYLEKSGYPIAFMEPFSKMKIKYDFYLCNQIKNKKYSDKWHLYYPSDLDTIPE